jgi:hypothetical protein
MFSRYAFDEVLRVVELAPVQPLEPAVPADLGQVGAQRLIVELRTGHQEHFGLHALHAGTLPAPPDSANGGDRGRTPTVSNRASSCCDSGGEARGVIAGFAGGLARL